MFGLLVRQASRQIRANIVQADHSIKLATCNYSDYGSDASRKARKRFYKNVSVCENGKGAYEINLDKRKLKTPSGTVFNVKSEMLANMCAFEWESQTKQIKLGTMHLTSMVNTCLDNPNKLTKEAVINSLLEYVPTDTILFFDANDGLSDPNGNLLQLQEKRWRPVVNWFNHKFPDMNLQITQEMSAIVADTLDPFRPTSFKKYLEDNFDLNSLIAFNYISESLKSVVITVALLERFIPSVDEACLLTNIEQESQYDKWGKVEWYHDVNETELRARVSAGLCYVYLSEDSKFFLHKTANKKINE